MVAQIPALLGAMAAGLIVSAPDDDDKHLGDAIRKADDGQAARLWSPPASAF